MLKAQNKAPLETSKKSITDITMVKSLNSVIKVKNVRVRRLEASEIPYIIDCNALKDVILLDSSVPKAKAKPVTKGLRTESVDMEEDNVMEIDPVTGCRLVGDPLKFEFLTLEKLAALNSTDPSMISNCLEEERCSKFSLDFNPLSKENFGSVEKALIDIKNQIPLSDDVGVLALYDVDQFNDTATIISGHQTSDNGKCAKTIETRFLGSGKALNSNLFTVFKYDQPKNTTFAVECGYDIIPATKPDDLDSPARVSCEYSVIGHWNTTSIKNIPSHPEDLTHMTVNYVAGWYDRRVYNTEKTYTLHFILYVVDNLHKGGLLFKNEENMDIEEDVREWLKNEDAVNSIKMDNRELDFTEQLWMRIRNITSISSLQNIFKDICHKLSSEDFKPYVHPNNNSTLGTLLRDPLHFKKLQGLLSTWEALLSTKTFVELGFEFVFREIMAEFNDLGITLENNGKLIYDEVFAEPDVSRRIYNIFPFFLALQFSRLTKRTFRDIPIAHLSRQAMTLINRYKKMTVKEMFSYAYTFRIPREYGCHFTFYDKVVEPDVWMCKSVYMDLLFHGRKVTNVVKLQKHNDLEMLDGVYSPNKTPSDKFLTEEDEEKLSLYYGTFTTIDDVPLDFF
uniref:Protein zwilch n=2 Tax=Strongyloides papillosus TaxID=174720 RepID=A0A0N5BJP0_STREA